MEELTKKLEALLFLAGEPQSVKRLSKAVEEKEERVSEALAELEQVLESRGVRLSEKDGEYMLVTAPELSQLVASFAGEEIGGELSRAMLETLAVVVYKGPTARSEIDYIRGVNSSFTMRNLMIRGLIERVQDSKDARIWRYRPSFEFLKFMGIEKLEKLPQYKEFRNEMEEFLKAEESRPRAGEKI